MTLAGHHRRCCIDHRPHRRDAERADDLATRDEGTEPMAHIDEFLTGETGEEVLVTAGEPHNLVRKDGADDHGDVALDHGAVDADRYLEVEAAA